MNSDIRQSRDLHQDSGYQGICPCDLGLIWNLPLSGACVFHKHILLVFLHDPERQRQITSYTYILHAYGNGQTFSM